MLPTTVSLASVVIAFFGHHWGEKFFTRRGQRDLKIIIKGYQIHHSCFGVLAIAAAIIVSGASAAALVGYGIGNLWQHKHAHNAVNEPGFVFISKVL